MRVGVGKAAVAVLDEEQRDEALERHLDQVLLPLCLTVNKRI